MTEASPGARPVGGCPAEGRARGEQASGKRASGKWAALRDVADRMTYRRGGLIGAPDPAPIHVPGETHSASATHTAHCTIISEPKTQSVHFVTLPWCAW